MAWLFTLEDIYENEEATEPLFRQGSYLTIQNLIDLTNKGIAVFSLTVVDPSTPIEQIPKRIQEVIETVDHHRIERALFQALLDEQADSFGEELLRESD